MYVCLECGEVFEELAQWEETHGFQDGLYEQFSGCPYCHSAYTKAFKCDCCEDWIQNAYIKTDDGKRYCENCYCHMELGEE